MEKLLQFSNTSILVLLTGKKETDFFPTKNQVDQEGFYCSLTHPLFFFTSAALRDDPSAHPSGFFRDGIITNFFPVYFFSSSYLKSEIISQNFLGTQWDFSHGFLRLEFLLGISVGPHCNKHFCQLNAVGVTALEMCTIG